MELPMGMFINRRPNEFFLWPKTSPLLVTLHKKCFDSKTLKMFAIFGASKKRIAQTKP
jgi:hypothetical protein